MRTALIIGETPGFDVAAVRGFAVGAKQPRAALQA
jgi:hypothetical protein